MRASYKGSRVISATTHADAAVRRDQILTGHASFADFAVQQSECSSTRRGGDLRCYFFP